MHPAQLGLVGNSKARKAIILEGPHSINTPLTISKEHLFAAIRRLPNFGEMFGSWFSSYPSKTDPARSKSSGFGRNVQVLRSLL